MCVLLQSRKESSTFWLKCHLFIHIHISFCQKIVTFFGGNFFTFNFNLIQRVWSCNVLFLFWWGCHVEATKGCCCPQCEHVWFGPGLVVFTPSTFEYKAPTSDYLDYFLVLNPCGRCIRHISMGGIFSHVKWLNIILKNEILDIKRKEVVFSF